MQKDQFCNLTWDICTPRMLLKCQVARYMHLVGGEWTIFDKFILSSKDYGNKTKKCIIHCWASRWFLLFYSLKPCSQVWILLYRNWSIVQLGSSFGSSFFLSRMKVAGGNHRPLVTALSTHCLPPPPPTPPHRRPHFNIIKMIDKTELTLLLLTHPTNHFPWEDDKLHTQCVVPEVFVHPAYTALPPQMS